MSGQSDRRPRDQHLATLLGTPEPPESDVYQAKKVMLARKMDRCDFISKARMKFIKNLHENNEQKARAITCFGDKRLSEASRAGLAATDAIFEAVKTDQKTKESVPKRLKIIHEYCTYLEVQAGKGFITKDQLDPLPTPGNNQTIAFDSFSPSYLDLVNNEPSPFKGGEDPKEPLLAVDLLQPYTAPTHVLEARRRAKARALDQIAAKKRYEEILKQQEKEREGKTA